MVLPLLYELHLSSKIIFHEVLDTEGSFVVIDCVKLKIQKFVALANAAKGSAIIKYAIA